MTEIIFRSDVDVEYIDHMGDDRRVAEAAWVSTKGAAAHEGDDKRIPGLINYLARDRHGSPFEHAVFTWRVRCPIFVIREIHRHRIASYNEESGRYTQLKPEFYIPARERNLTQIGKPGHYQFHPGSDFQYGETIDGHRDIASAAYSNYQNLLNIGVAKEVARMTLPLNIYSSFYVTMNARALMNFLSLRTEREDSTFPSHPQKEIQMVADEMEEIWADIMPVTWKAFNDNGRVAP
jgi:thymidylate synthase (FAD)